MANIVIVDDDEMIAEMASEILISAGHACGWVCDGEKALQLLQWRRPDLLLLDQDMPAMSGSVLLRKLRQSPTFYDLPVIMFTAMTGAEDEMQAIYNGAQDYIRKPFDAKFLVWRVNQLLRTRAERPQHKELGELMKEGLAKAARDVRRERAVS
ncbi:response regulator [Altererythrobacter aquiaggeris]|uniref:response regulator n=1 Tax=Aestuarierythrobacter aquiaggeris TaxID=1898396 RepID=UPI00301936E0